VSTGIRRRRAYLACRAGSRRPAAPLTVPPPSRATRSPPTRAVLGVGVLVARVSQWTSQNSGTGGRVRCAREALEARAVHQALLDQMDVLFDRLPGGGSADVDPLRVPALPADDVDAHAAGSLLHAARGCARSTDA